MTRQPGTRFYKTVVIVWLTLSVGSVVLAIISWLELSTKLAEGRRANAVREDLDNIIKQCLDAETATRGFVITDNTNYLAAYSQAMPGVSACFDDLVSQSRNDAAALQDIT